ncbi:hypothetical protein SEVIR_4G256350v4 [Setaria viridis]
MYGRALIFPPCFCVGLRTEKGTCLNGSVVAISRKRHAGHHSGSKLAGVEGLGHVAFSRATGFSESCRPAARPITHQETGLRLSTVAASPFHRNRGPDAYRHVGIRCDEQGRCRFESRDHLCISGGLKKQTPQKSK